MTKKLGFWDFFSQATGLVEVVDLEKNGDVYALPDNKPLSEEDLEKVDNAYDRLISESEKVSLEPYPTPKALEDLIEYLNK